MARYKWLVFTNCAPGHDDEFNKWYDETHLPDLLRVPGVVKAYRLGLAEPQLIADADGQMAHSRTEAAGARHPYLAVYEFDTEDPAVVLEEIRLRAGTPRMMISPHLVDPHTVLFRDR